MKSVATLLLALALLAVASPTAFGNQRPNIVFVFSDDHATSALGAYRGFFESVAPTPEIDRLAREGALFESCYCTNSICGPSRAVILTGKHSHVNGFRQNRDRFDGSQTTFPKLLQKAGYQTAVFGKWHLGSNPTGFDTWEVLPGQGFYYNPVFVTPEGRRQREGYVTDVVTERTIDWLRHEREPGKPFMVMCQHKAPHSPWQPAARHLTMFDGQDIPEPPTLLDDYHDNARPVRAQEATIRDFMIPSNHLLVPPKPVALGKRKGAFMFRRDMKRMTPEQRAEWTAAFAVKNKVFWQSNLEGDELVKWKYQRYIKNYLRCIKAVDESLGSIRAELERLGLSDNTIVIYSSDQGMFLGEHGWFDKRWMYEESLRMPLVVHWPGVTRPGQRIDEMVQNLDFAETFCEIAGHDVPDDMQGHSLVPLLRGEKPADWRQAIYYHYFEYPSYRMVAKHRGVRTRRHKLIHFYEFDEWEFYDLEKDPDEVSNVYAQPEYRAEVETLKTQLQQLRDQYQDDSNISKQSEEWIEKHLKPKQ